MSKNILSHMMITYISSMKGYFFMKERAKIAVLGGDMRQYVAAVRLSERGAQIYAYGISFGAEDTSEVKMCQNIDEALDGADGVILPLPVTADGISLNCPAIKSNERITLEMIIDLIDPPCCICGGRIPESVKVKAQTKGLCVYDYFEDERLQIKNAYITAEAALSIAMNSLDMCVKDARLVITGTGRISRLLADLLIRIGADVTVVARNADSLTYFEIMGCKTAQIKEGTEWNRRFTTGYDIIFNTVPAWLFDRGFLELADKKMLIIELASAPGGVDICAARELSSNVLWASSLPGKYAPHSAGILIAECIADILSREGINVV